MGAYDQITRIKNNVTASLSVVQEKGVSVPAGANSDNLPGLIAQISGGDASVEEITNEAGGKSVYINSEVPKLPEGFTRLQYIQSSGTQYVNTGFKPNQNTRVVMDLQGATTTSGVYMHYGVPSFMAGKASSRSWNYYVYYNTQEVAYSTRAASDFTARHTIDQNKNVITTGADTRTLTAATFSSGYNMYLFGVNNNGSLAYASPIRVFSCKIYDNGTLVRDYVPCKNASGTVGLYDMVNGAFYADSAGGAFVAGPVVLEYELPEGYEELAWIQSSGSQYMDTGFVPNQDTRVVCECDYSATSSASWLFGVRVSSGQSAFAFLANSNKFRTDYKNSYTLNFAETTTLAKKVDKNKNVTTVNDGETITDTYADFDSVYPLYLFAINTAGSASGFASAKLKMMQIYDNGTLVRDYVPCKNASGEVGMWDAVNNTFTGDAAGVGFIAGPGKGVSKVVLEDRVLIDLTNDTISPETVVAGMIGHDKTGAQFVGELVQKAGGRPIARGSFTTNLYQSSQTISGLSFRPKVVVLFWNSATNHDYDTLTSAYQDDEINVSRATYARYDSYYYLWIFSIGSTKIITTNDDGFVCKMPSTANHMRGKYYWVAVGAEG